MIPNQIMINNVPFKVQEVENLTLNDEPHFGVYDPRNFEILINSQLPSERKHATLLHEVIHAISDDRNLQLSENDVDQLAKGLFATLVANPEILPETSDLKRIRTRITDEKVCGIRKLAAEGHLQNFIAKKFNCSQSSVSNIVTGARYSDVVCDKGTS